MLWLKCKRPHVSIWFYRLLPVTHSSVNECDCDRFVFNSTSLQLIPVYSSPKSISLNSCLSFLTLKSATTCIIVQLGRLKEWIQRASMVF